MADTFFFSYARSDTEFALRLADELRSLGLDLWVDQLDIPAGAQWDDAIQDALTECASLLLVISPESVASQNVKDEVSYALEEKKRIVPALYRECDIPFRWRRFQRAEFSGGFESGLEQLRKMLDLSSSVPGPPAMRTTPPEGEPSSPDTEEAPRRRATLQRWVSRLRLRGSSRWGCRWCCCSGRHPKLVTAF